MLQDRCKRACPVNFHSVAETCTASLLISKAGWAQSMITSLTTKPDQALQDGAERGW